MLRKYYAAWSDKSSLTIVSFEGGFKANVIVKGEDFQCSFEGIMGSNPPEARESAAAQMLTHFKNMAKLAQWFWELRNGMPSPS